MPSVPRSCRVRFSVDPRDVPPAKAARRLHLTIDEFEALLPQLVKRGFPTADADTGNYDLKRIDEWMDNRSVQTPRNQALDAREVVNDRIERM
ncbi:hypothetical protein AXW83_06120 [Bosea sp. PAMC 26642]|nr:hypothetical protein AXW83_06120 [Bosea sp. PAMC 26642]